MGQTRQSTRTPFQELDLIASLDKQEIANRILEVRETESLTKWELGRIVNDLYVKARKHHKKVTKDDCCLYVAANLDNQERSIPSLRLFARIAEIFPPRTITNSKGKSQVLPPEDQFLPLPYSHFERAARYADARYNVLEISLQLMDTNGGRPVSADALERRAESLGYTRDAQTEAALAELAAPMDYSLAAPVGEPATGSMPAAIVEFVQAARTFAHACERLKATLPTAWAKKAGELERAAEKVIRDAGG